MSNLRERLEQIKAATKGHTPGPWFVEPCNVVDCWCALVVTKPGSDILEDCVIPSGSVTKEDAAFIAAAPELLTLATEAIEENERLREALANYGTHDDDCVAGQSRAGRPTEDGGYETLYGYGPHEAWYRRGEAPPCTCGFRAALKGDQ